MRDKYLCRICGNPAQEVHHKEHLSPENLYNLQVNLNPDNLISLCRSCHQDQHQEDKKEGRKRYYSKKKSACAEGYHFDESGQLVPDEPGNG